MACVCCVACVAVCYISSDFGIYAGPCVVGLDSVECFVNGMVAR